ncbi:MAG: AraC family transcriptional regulator [Dysgonomonas sp.]|uniref:AraC family transcriptional regulator n=1 Tax=Dysgonomonas sp. TaxID=1891233 RepID=UPI003A8C86D6
MKKRSVRKNKVLYGLNTSIKYIKTDGRNKDYIYVQHKHEDYQLRLITKGEGLCMIGDNIVEFKKGDILFVGQNVPHCSSLFELEPGEGNIVESDILQFHPDIFPRKINELPDYIHINDLLNKSQYGIVFNNTSLGTKIKKIIDDMQKVEGIEKILLLLRILDKLGRSKYSHLVSEVQFSSQNTFCDGSGPLQRTYDYLYRNMKNEITLEEISKYANINPAALCRTFKSKTRMTIFQFLNKIRIENVCKLLLYSDLTVSEIANKSGFNSMPYFNRRFKESTNMSPSEYRQKIKKILYKG